MATQFIDRVQDTIRAHNMAAPGDRVLAAVSGGPDSVCLLHVLLELGFAVEAAHLDHQTRDGESAADAEFTRGLCEKLGVPLHATSRPIAAEAEQSPLSFEEYARNARYAFLTATAQAQGISIIATGHHADDQAETVLMRVLRGTSPGGLAGIPPVRVSGTARIIRPLIAVYRRDILAYLSEHELSYRTDKSNADYCYLRNKVRNLLIPELATAYNPGLPEALARLAEVQRAENELLDEAASDFLERCFSAGRIDRGAFTSGALACQRRAIVAIGWRYGVECPFDRVEAARAFIMEGATGASCDLGGGVTLRNSRDRTDVLTGAPRTDDRVIALAVPGETPAFGRVFRVREIDARVIKSLMRYCSPTRQVLDADAVTEPLFVRFRRPGDRFIPYGMSGTKKLQDYFVDAGVPATERDSIPLLACGDKIAWVVGYAVATPFAVKKDEGRILEVEVVDATE
ncbi:MAG: tRNA lysidine(34) synthetase TilS [Candidatus Hydrogenedentes bacterium]|nr:tRNA lysidine(34) synthetase TilS [Candidatus Hydrogenedentota bacterium]